MYALDAETLSRLTDLRVSGGAQLQVFAAQRPRRATLTRDGRLLILAADHPARMVTGVGDDPLRMGNRADYLGRIVHILEQDCVDGLMGTADIIEEVLAVDLLRCEGGAESFLADKVLVGCMNRGGLAGTVFEMEDAFTGFTAEQMMSLGLDGAKMMFRLEPMEFASGRTIEACSRAIDACVDNDLAVFLEPLPVRFEDGKYVVEKSVEELVKVCGVASGLGKSSWKTWLKIPYSVDYSAWPPGRTYAGRLWAGTCSIRATPIRRLSPASCGSSSTGTARLRTDDHRLRFAGLSAVPCAMRSAPTPPSLRRPAAGAPPDSETACGMSSMFVVKSRDTA